MKKWPIFFFLLGLVSILGQAVILREVVNLTYGNEFIYCLGLGLWLVLVGLGSLAGRKVEQKSTWSLWLILILWSGLIPALVIFLRILTSNLIVPGQLLSFNRAFWLLFLPLLIFCPVLGGLFVVGKKSFKNSLNSAYFWETIGFFIGGIVFSFFLAKTSFPLGVRTDRTNPPSPSAEGFLLRSSYGGQVGRASRTFLEGVYPGLKRVINSPYQQIIETESDGQTNIYLSGQLAFNSQAKVENELLAGLIFPFSGTSDKVLVSGSVNLASAMALFPRVRQIEYLELDPSLLALEKNFLHPRVKPQTGDLKVFLKNSPLDYDLIVLSLPPPSSLFLNRFYTQEFFQIVQKSLKKNGSFVLIFPLPTGYQSQEALRFARSIYQTFESVFTSDGGEATTSTPPRWTYLFSLEDQVVLIGGREMIKPDKKQLDFLEKIYPSFSADYFQYQVGKMEKELLLKKLQVPAEINRESFPVAFFYQTLFWQTLFNFQLPKLLYDLRFWIPFFFLGGVFSIMYRINRTNRTFKKLLLVFFSGFILMSMQIILIFLFQTKFGSVYSKIAFLNGLVLLGMAGGVGIVREIREIREMREMRSWVIGYLLVMAGIFLEGKNYLNFGLWFWWLMAIFLGFTGGSIFAFISNQFSGKKEQTLVYTFDLLGAFLGAILSGLFFFPVLGLYKTLLVLVALIILVCWRG